jgi:hypothetical protein
MTFSKLKTFLAALSFAGLVCFGASAQSPTIVMLAPGAAPSASFVAASGNVYQSSSIGLITNVAQVDIPSLQAQGATLLTPRNNVSATRAPLGTDDFTAEYGVGSQWVYLAGGGPNIYILTSMTATPGSAVWTQVSALGGGTINSGTAGRLGYYATTGTVISGNANLNVSGGALTVGLSGSVLGSLKLTGSTSGTATIVPPVVAGTPTLTLPTQTETLLGSADINSTLTYASNVLGCTTATTLQFGCIKPDGTTITISGGVISAVGSGGGGSGTVNSGTLGQVAYYPASSNAVSGESLSSLFDNSLGNVVGNIICRSPAGWTVLAPGAAGLVLKSNSTGNCPSWVAAGSGSGTVNAGTIGQFGYYVAGGTAVSGHTFALADLPPQLNQTILGNFSGGTTTPAPNGAEAVFSSGFTSTTPCGFMKNMGMSPDSAAPTTQKIFIGPAFFNLCTQAAWNHATAVTGGSVWANTPSVFVSNVGQGGRWNVNHYSIGINIHAGFLCGTLCVSSETAPGGIDPWDPSDPSHPGAATAQPSTSYNVYLVAKSDGLGGYADSGLVISSGLCTSQGPSAQVQAAFPYWSCIDWLFTSGAGNTLQFMTTKNDHFWQFGGGTGTGTGGTASLLQFASGIQTPQWVGTFLSSYGLSSSTGTFILGIHGGIAGSARVAPNIHFGNFQPCATAASGSTAGSTIQCWIVPDQGQIGVWSTDPAAFYYVEGGYDAF